MTPVSEKRAVAVVAAVLAAGSVLWGAGWAVREAVDEDPSPLELATDCLRREHGLESVTPTGDPLADSAPGGAFRTTILGNEVVVSVWADGAAAAATLATYDRLTPQELEGRAVARGRLANLWASPATGEQSTVLYGCEG